jgi:two-component sensor histidine kinase
MTSPASAPSRFETCRQAVPGRRAADLLAESNHRIANNLSMVAALLRLQTDALGKAHRPLSPAQARTLLQEASERIDTVGRLHRLLSRAPDGAGLDLGGYLAEIALGALTSMAPCGAAPHFIAELREASLPPAEALSVGVIVGELVTNAVKYAHPAGVAGEIHLRCEQIGGSTLVEVADDGVGLPEGFDPAVDGGLGLRLVRSLATRLGADLVFEQSELGLCVRLWLA